MTRTKNRSRRRKGKRRKELMERGEEGKTRDGGRTQEIYV